jgi:hypothetical protein
MRIFAAVQCFKKTVDIHLPLARRDCREESRKLTKFAASMLTKTIGIGIFGK